MAQRSTLRSLPWLLWLVAGSLLLSVGAFVALRRQDAAVRRADFAQRAQSQVLFLQYALMQQTGILQELRALQDASENVTRDEFRRFCQHRLNRESPIRMLAWVPRVSRIGVDRLLAEEAGGPVTGFMLTEMAADRRVVPAGVREEYFPVRYVEPHSSHRALLGFDMGSLSECARLLAKARDSGEAAASSPVEFPTDNSGGPIVVLALPIFEGGLVPDNVADRRRRLRGFVVGSFRMDDFMYSSFTSVRDYELFFRIRDASEQGNPLVFVGDPWRRHRPQEELESSALRDLRAYQQTIRMVDRTWMVTCLPTQEGGGVGQYRSRAWVILVFGGLFTILLGAQVWSMQRRTHLVQRLVDERTRDLRMEVDVRRRVETELRLARDQLELRVGERTLDLARANAALRDEIQTRRAAEDALQNEKERLGVTLDSIADAVIALDVDGTIVLMNPAAERLCHLHFDAVRGRLAREVLPLRVPEDKALFDSMLAAVIERRRAVELPSTAVVEQAGQEPVMVAGAAAPICERAGKVAGVVLAFRDITAQHRREAELATLGRLEALGVLAGGIAHDFNNILTAIMGNASLLRMEQGDADTETTAMIREIETAAIRAKNLTQQLLTFSKGGAPVREVASLGDLLRESVAFALRGAASRCEFDIAPDLWSAEVDVAQVRQVIQHLVINADQAMRGGGVILVSAQNKEVVPELGLPLKLGPYIQVSVTDTGVGIPEAMLTRIFDPYFTTKPKGSGLGLSTSFSIVRRHGGHISAQSREGEGSTFVLYLPALKNPAPVTAPGPAARLPGGKRGGRILVMDDEEPIRRFVRRMLTTAGYEVTEAADGEQAVRLYEEAMGAGRPFQATILDLTVSGGMGGRDAMTKLRALDPAVRALVSSGYSTDAAMGDYRAWGFAAVVAKPYQAEELLAKLDDLLSRAAV